MCMFFQVDVAFVQEQHSSRAGHVSGRHIIDAIPDLLEMSFDYILRGICHNVGFSR